MNQDKIPSPPLQPAENTRRRLNLQKILIIVMVIVLVSVALILRVHHQHKRPTSQPNHEIPESGLQTETELSAFKQEVTVTISAKDVTPQTLIIPNDTRINWMNKDIVAHKLAITPGTMIPPKFDNFHLIDPEGGYPYVIHQAGTFHYYLVNRPTQGGTIIVKS